VNLQAPGTELLIAMGVASMATFIGTLAVIPLIAARIPEDYFVNDHRPAWGWSRCHPALYLLLLLLKNAAGLFFLGAGIAMLFLPGQGVLTILLGLTFMNFPGKRRLEKALVRRPAVHRAVNWIRRKAGRRPLLVPAGRVRPAD